MTSTPLPAAATPFPLFCEHSDVHGILFIEGHPEYEAVEAMVTRRPQRIRVILTRHDQSQEDHVDDAALAATLAPLLIGRTVRHSSARLQWASTRLPGFTVSFQDGAGRRIELRVQAASTPDARHARLVDPGDHAAASSLPLMLGQRVALAGTASQVVIDGVEHRPALKVDTATFQAVNGYYTEDFSLGGLRAASARPIGEWPGGVTETAHTDAFSQAHRIWLRFATALPLGIEAMPWAGAFSLGFGSGAALVEGQADLRQAGGARELRLQPRSPQWAQARPVLLRFEPAPGQGWCLQSSVGPHSADRTTEVVA